MTESSTTERAPDQTADQAAQDHDAIQSFLNSKDWEEQLRVARLKREQVLAERARLRAEAGSAEPVKLPVLPIRTLPIGVDAPQRFAKAAPPVVAIALSAAEVAPPLAEAAPHPVAVPPPAPIAKFALFPIRPAPAAPSQRPKPRAAAVPALTREVVVAPIAGQPDAVARSLRRSIALGLSIGIAAGLVIVLVLQPVALALLSRSAQVPDLPEVLADLPDAPQPGAVPAGSTNGTDPIRLGHPMLLAQLPDAQANPVAPPLAASADRDAPAIAPQSNPAAPEVSSVSPVARPPLGSVDVSMAATLIADPPQPNRTAPNLAAVALTGIDADPSHTPPLAAPLPASVSALTTAPSLQANAGDAPTLGLPASVLSPAPSPSTHLRLALTPLPSPDTPPAVVETTAIPDADTYRLNLHLAQAASGAVVRGRLAALGFVNASVEPSGYAVAQAMVAYYRSEDAEVAAKLAKLYGGKTMDLTGFTPAPAARTLDLYLSD